MSVAAAIVAAGTFAACLVPLSCSGIGALDVEPAPDVVLWHLSTLDVERHDITPPTRLDVVLDVEHVDRVLWCSTSGGVLDGTVCRDVDY